MKKTAIILVFISFTFNSFAQNKSALEILADVLAATLKSANPNSELSNGGTISKSKEWSEWRSTPSFRKIQYSVICDEKLQNLNKYSWRIRFKSEYGEDVYGEFIVGSSKYEAEKNCRAKGVISDGTYKQVDYRGNLPRIQENDKAEGYYIVSSPNTIYIDVSELSFGPWADSIRLKTDYGQDSLRCQVYPNGCKY